MHCPVTTKVESAWYVDPELLAGEEMGESVLDVEAGAEPRPNETMALAPEDLVDAGDVLLQETENFQSGARHYRSVSLKGALLAQEESGSTSIPESFNQSLLSRFNWSSKFESVTDYVSAAVSKVEGGYLPPARLALLSFFAGVGTTLVGVFIAL